MNRLQAAEQLRRALQLFAASLPEEQALEVATVYPAWAAGTAYKVGDIVSYGTNNLGDPQLYKIVQAHTSQADWLPDATPALYEAFGLNAEGYPLWAQPSGAHDAYNAGDIVDYQGTLYRSLIDGNVWAPDVYPAGWEVYATTTEPEPGPEPEPETPAEYPAWVQPTGAHDAYGVGDRVTYQGKVYESTVASNVWSPAEYPQGWREITE